MTALITEDVLKWSFGHLESLGFSELRVETVRNRPWAEVARLGCGDQSFYLKATVPDFRIEGELQSHLLKYLNAPIVEVLSYHTDMSAFLMKDAGEPLRQLIIKTRDLNSLKEFLQRYAQMQIKSSRKLSDLSNIGLQNWSLSELPEMFEDMLRDIDDKNSNLSQREINTLIGTKGVLRNLCGRLDDLKLPMTFDHADFNDGNILASESGELVFTDSGESVIGHPFLSVVNFTENFRRRHGHELDNQLQAACDCYLQEWSKYASIENLEFAMRLAQKLHPIRYALAFHRLWKACNNEMSDRKGQMDPALREWLSMLGRECNQQE